MSEPGRQSPAEPPRVGYVLKMFPRLSETFILNEVLELERQGLLLQIFSLKRPVDAVSHPQAQAVRSPIGYLPESIWEAPRRLLRAQVHVGRKYRRAWWHALRHALHSVRVARDLAELLPFCQACCLIYEMPGLRHLHAHYANVPAKVALIVHRLTGISYSITTHAKDIFQDDPFSSPKLLERMRQARFIVGNSRFSAEHIRTGLNGQGEVHTVCNGLDLEAFPMRRTAPVEPMVLSVGRLVEKKGFTDLVHACACLKQRGIEFSCELVGTGRLSSVIKEQIRDGGVGDCVKMIGPLPQPVLRGHYERAMVFALPCVVAPDGDRDILPNVLKEAMAVGVPVVTTHLPGIEELVTHGENGLLVPPGDVEALAASLESLLTDAVLRRRLVAGGRKMIEERFDIKTNFASLKELLVQAAEESGTEQVPQPGQDASAPAHQCNEPVS